MIYFIIDINDYFADLTGTFYYCLAIFMAWLTETGWFMLTNIYLIWYKKEIFADWFYKKYFLTI